MYGELSRNIYFSDLIYNLTRIYTIKILDEYYNLNDKGLPRVRHLTDWFVLYKYGWTARNKSF